MVPAHPLVRAEWPHIIEVPAYDFQVTGVANDLYAGIYVRRVSGFTWHTLAGLINHVVVAPNARDNGLGSLTVGYAIAWLKEVGVPYALVHCEPKARGFYGHLGFVPAPNFPAPSHHGERVSMVAEFSDRLWPTSPVEYVEPW